MKKTNMLLCAVVIGLLASCAPTSVTFYQVYKTSNEGLQKNDDAMIFSDENCEVSYNLWGEGGNIGFRFYNKTDQNIYLNLDECFFIMNGIALNYYKNRTYTYSAGSGASISNSASETQSASVSTDVTGVNYSSLLQTNSILSGASLSIYSSSSLMTSKGFSLTLNEEKIICVPAKTSKVITEYAVNKTPYRDCDLLRFPSAQDKAVKVFTKSNSPFVFSNRIVYRIGQSETKNKIENSFYVSEISNMSEDQIFTYEKQERCGERSLSKYYFFKDIAPDIFYIEYTRPNVYKWNY